MDGRCTLSFPDRVTNTRLFHGAVERERNRLAKEKKVIVGLTVGI